MPNIPNVDTSLHKQVAQVGEVLCTMERGLTTFFMLEGFTRVAWISGVEV